MYSCIVSRSKVIEQRADWLKSHTHWHHCIHNTSNLESCLFSPTQSFYTLQLVPATIKVHTKGAGKCEKVFALFEPTQGEDDDA